MIVLSLKIAGLFTAGISLSLLLGQLFPHIRELTRKSAHLICGTLALFLPLFKVNHWAILIICGSFSLILGGIKFLHGFKKLFEVGRFSFGVMLMPMGIYLNYLLARGDAFLYLCGILTLTYADALASLVGSRASSAVISRFNKSQLGSLAFFALAFSLIFLCGMVLEPSGLLVPYAVLAAVFITGIELVSPWGSDNLFIPLASYFILYLLFRTPFNWFGITISFCSLAGIVFQLRPRTPIFKRGQAA